MQSIGVKIFLAYWITTAIVIAVTNSIIPEQLRRPELIRQVVRTSLELNGKTLTSAYESGGCAAVASAFPAAENQIYLADSSGQLLCGGLDASGVHPLVAKVKAVGNIASKRYGLFQLVAISVASASGRPYIVFLKSRYASPLQLFGWLPGPTSFAISGVVTLVLAFLLTWPIRKLRIAARQIATGNLDARVRWGGLPNMGDKLRKGDEIQGLMHDFNDMAARLQALMDAQRLLLRDVSHELRSPLSRLAVALELGREEATGAMHVHLDRIEREATRLNNLIGQLMALSYMDTIREVAQPVNISFNKLITDLLPDVQYEAAGRGCHITATIARNCMVCGDADLLQRALENIIRNAIHYTPQDSVVKIDLDTDRSDGRPRAVLRVSDNGPGVPDDELEAILRPFYRVDKARQSSTGGFGIGLAIADRAAHLHEGKIVARNHPDGGLTVEMHVPLVNPGVG
jgi:two-component system, OmpR family, sensor histidine kinase CpxA